MKIKSMIALAAAVVITLTGSDAIASELTDTCVPGLTKAVLTGSSFDLTSDVYSNAVARVHYPTEMYADSLAELTTVAWAGFMKMEGGVTYNFKGRYDDYVAVKINGEWILSKGSECQERTGSYTPPTTDWYSVEFRVGNNKSGGGCPSSEYYGIIWSKSNDSGWRKINNGWFDCSFKTHSLDVPVEGELPAVENGSVGISNIVCQQRYPWNGKVDIDFTVTSDDANADVWVYPMGYDKDANVSMACRALEGAGVNAPVKPGRHRMTWNVTADYPDFASTAFNVKMIALMGGAPYMVVDLSGGVDAQSYPVTYLSSVPAGGWTDEYKTTKLVLRLIPPGTFMMGSPTDELGRDNREDLHRVTLTKPFYIGVFELTQQQYIQVMGSNPGWSGNEKCPALGTSYTDIRGSVNGIAWPAHNQVDADSFMGRLRSKVNMLFDLPTEAQWEYACRAGTGTALNNGKNLTSTTDRCANLDEVAWYYPRSNGNINTVGNYLPNAWGLYDMHGNTSEWCLDRPIERLGSTWAVDPKGATTGEYRVFKGGGYGHYDYYYYLGSGCAKCCRSAWRGDCNPTYRQHAGYIGFRVACLPAE